MNYYIKIGGFMVLGYIALWLLFMICMYLKLFFDDYGYPNLNFLSDFFNYLFYI